jgi:hypothetical protein
VARQFGYSQGSFHVLCHHFRREPEPSSLSAHAAAHKPSPKSQPPDN